MFLFRICLFCTWCHISGAVEVLPVVSLRSLDQRRFEYFQNISSFDDFIEPTTITLRGSDPDYQVPEGTNSLLLTCRARYPIIWDLNRAHYASSSVWRLRTDTRRSFKDFYDYSSYNYTATLELMSSYGDASTMSGRYTCRGARNDSLAVHVYIYWKSTSALSKPNLVLAKETVSLAYEEPVVLPCHLTVPTAPRPVLYKGDVELRPNSSIAFDPKVGFTLHGFPDPKGTYKCVINETYDFVTIQVGEDPSASLVTVNYDVEKKQVTCCGSGGKAPEMHFYYCDNPVMCELFGRLQFDALKYHDVNIIKSSRRPECSIYKMRFMNNGLVVCGGPHFTNVSHNVLFPLTDMVEANSRGPGSADPLSTFPAAWSRWSEISPEEMIIIMPMKKASESSTLLVPEISGKQETYYSGQNISIACITSTYYYAADVMWILNFRNGTARFVNTTKEVHSDDDFGSTPNDHFGELTVPADESLVSIVCLAPVWNSSVWIHKPFFPYVNLSSVPDVSIVSVSTTLEWYVNDTDKEIACEAHGSPQPKISWLKDNETLEDTHNNEISYEVKTGASVIVRSVLSIQRVSYHTGGLYFCRATNVAGERLVSIKVNVLELSSWGAGATVGIVVACVLTLVVLGGLLIWKLEICKGQPAWTTAIRQPVIENEVSPAVVPENIRHSTDSYNHSFDPVALNANLVN